MRIKLFSSLIFGFPLLIHAQTNVYPNAGNPTIYDYSPQITLQRNINEGGFTQGIQTKLADGSNNWFFGALNTDNFVVAKGDYSNPSFSVASSGNVGIGTLNPDNVQSWQRVLDLFGSVNSKLLVRSNSVKTGIFSHENWGSVPMGRMGTESNHDLGLMAGYGNVLMTLKTDGNVGIGTHLPKEKLSVNGKIRAQEVKVEVENWPDYVFEEGYNVGTLEGLESYIKANKHLPDVPSAKEVEANGVDLGEMNKLLLKKIEELTLHLIEQGKEIQLLKSKVNKP